MDEIVAGKIIAELRKKKGLTQKQLAAVLGVTDKAVSRWENGYGLPDVSLLPKIAAAFDVTVDELLTGRRPHSSVSETLSSAPPARQTSSEDEIGKICEENRRGLFRLRLRQVTQNEFTFPALFVYLALFCLCLFYSPVQATLSRGAYSLSPCEWLRCIFDKPYLHGYFSVDTKNRLETFLTLLPFLSFVQLVLSLALLVKTVKGNPGGGMKPEWCLAFVTALGILLAGSCIPFVNKIYGTEKYKIPAGYYPIAALGVLQLVGGYAVSCHRKPKRKIKLFSAGPAFFRRNRRKRTYPPETAFLFGVAAERNGRNTILRNGSGRIWFFRRVCDVENKSHDRPRKRKKLSIYLRQRPADGQPPRGYLHRQVSASRGLRGNSFLSCFSPLPAGKPGIGRGRLPFPAC